MSEKDGGPALTEWYPAHIKPVREGVYEIKAGPPPWFRYWNGSSWHWGGDTPLEALGNKMIFKFNDNAQWRGLAERAK